MKRTTAIRRPISLHSSVALFVTSVLPLLSGDGRSFFLPFFLCVSPLTLLPSPFADVPPSMTGRRPKTSDKGATFWSVRASERASAWWWCAPPPYRVTNILSMLPHKFPVVRYSLAEYQALSSVAQAVWSWQKTLPSCRPVGARPDIDVGFLLFFSAARARPAQRWWTVVDGSRGGGGSESA